MMRALVFSLLVMLGPVAVPASALGECLPMDQVRVAVRTGQVIPLIQALHAARGAAAGEVIDSRLCGGPGNFRYVVTLLSQDGRVMRVTIDAQSGAVLAVK